MLQIKFDLSEFEAVEVVPLADVHMGNPLVSDAELKKTIDYILEEPDDPRCARICLLNGDLTESVTKTTRSGEIFEQTMSPSVQVATMINYLKPLAETSKKYPQGKIMSYCAGNHDNGRYKDTGISASETIAVGLGLQERYSEDGCYCFIKLKMVSKQDSVVYYTLYNQHMSGGGSTIGGKANRVAKISNGVIAQCIVGAHTHSPLTFKEDIIMPSHKMMNLVQNTITYVICSSFLNYGGYAQRAGMKPTSIAMPRIFVYQGNVHSERFIKTEVLL